MLNISLIKQQAYDIHTQLIHARTEALCNGTKKDESESIEALVCFESACVDAGFDPNKLEA